ncbi:MAG: hypothetical protein RhofKO_24770 [Rhodothermales bacterium]
MSHRTNYAIRERGEVRFATSRHDGTSIPDLLFKGADYVRAYIQDERIASANDLYSTAQCEGLVLLDIDEHLVLFDGVSELMFEGAMRRLWYPLLCDVWSGWTLQHTASPVRHLGQHLRLSRSWIDAKAPDATLPPSDAQVLLTRHPSFVNDYQTEIQWCSAGRAWTTTVTDARPLDLLDTGPALLNVLPQASAVMPIDRLAPWGLLRIDSQERQLHIWTDLAAYRLAAETEARWPGWSVALLSLDDAARLSQQPKRFFPTQSETAHAMDTMRARLDGPAHQPFAQALLLHEALSTKRASPSWQRGIGS